MAVPSYLRYSNQGATRNLPVSDRLVRALSFLPELGLTAEVYSGGQLSAEDIAKAGRGKRTGSTRHDHGEAGDMRFYQGDRRLSSANAADRELLAEIVRRGKAAGLTGFGMGDDYMGPESMHVGFGNPGVWGAKGQGANAPDWLRAAYEGGGEQAGRNAIAAAMTERFGAEAPGRIEDARREAAAAQLPAGAPLRGTADPMMPDEMPDPLAERFGPGPGDGNEWAGTPEIIGGPGVPPGGGGEGGNVLSAALGGAGGETSRTDTSEAGAGRNWGNILADILGYSGDALLLASGRDRAYGNWRQRQAEKEAEMHNAAQDRAQRDRVAATRAGLSSARSSGGGTAGRPGTLRERQAELVRRNYGDEAAEQFMLTGKLPGQEDKPAAAGGGSAMAQEYNLRRERFGEEEADAWLKGRGAAGGAGVTPPTEDELAEMGPRERRAREAGKNPTSADLNADTKWRQQQDELATLQEAASAYDPEDPEGPGPASRAALNAGRAPTPGELNSDAKWRQNRIGVIDAAGKTETGIADMVGTIMALDRAGGAVSQDNSTLGNLWRSARASPWGGRQIEGALGTVAEAERDRFETSATSILQHIRKLSEGSARSMDSNLELTLNRIAQGAVDMDRDTVLAALDRAVRTYDLGGGRDILAEAGVPTEILRRIRRQEGEGEGGGGRSAPAADGWQDMGGGVRIRRKQ